MTSKTRTRSFQWLALASMAAALAGCGGGSEAPGAAMSVNAEGMSTFNSAALAANLASYPLQTLSSAESAGLSFMRDEERLAQAVYTASAARWPALPSFNNIAASEATHTAAIKSLLDRYQIADPAAGLALSSFAPAVFQTLYANLTAASNASQIDALKVGVQIEELDIRDIVVRKADVDNADILLVYDQLLKGSRNHLRAYMRVLTQQAGTYTPQYITQAEFDAIVNSPMETGP